MKKIAIVTGGSRGIGAAIALLLAEAGADICLSYQSDRAAGEDVAGQCAAKGVSAIAVQADVGHPNEVKQLFAACDAQLGPANILINNAGIVGDAGPLVELAPEMLERVFAVNLFGAVYCCQEAIKRMSKAKGGNGGSIVNISSMAAKFGSPNEYIQYAASKGAMDSMTIGLAKEVGPDGIRVNAVAPSAIPTEGTARNRNPERDAKRIADTPLGRLGTVEDVARAIGYLLGEESDFITGQVLSVDGGIGIAIR